MLLFGSLWKRYLFWACDCLITFPLWYQLILVSYKDEYSQINIVFSLISHLQSISLVKILGFRSSFLFSINKDLLLSRSDSFFKLLNKSMDSKFDFLFWMESNERQTVAKLSKLSKDCDCRSCSLISKFSGFRKKKYIKILIYSNFWFEI